MFKINLDDDEPAKAPASPESTVSTEESGVDVSSIAAAHDAGTIETTGVKKRRKRVRLATGELVLPEDVAGRPLWSPSMGTPPSVGSSVAGSSQPTLDKEQVVTAVKALFKIVDTRVSSAVYRAAKRLDDDEKFCTDLKESVSMTEEERESMTSLTVIVLEKYQVLGTYAPEALLGLCVIGYAYRVQQTFSELKKLRVELAKQAVQPASQ